MLNNKNYYKKETAKIWDDINECLLSKTTAISHDDYLRAQAGELKVSLAGVKIVPKAWFPALTGKDVLALASGGGQQAPIFAAHGANVTVTDLSGKQLANERYVAEREGYSINIVKADLSEIFPFPDHSFDLIFNPISNCYVESIQSVWDECARVLRKNGVLMMAFVKEEFFMFEPDYKNEDFLISRHSLPFNPYKDLSEQSKKKFIEEHRPFAFSHSLTEQIGGLIKAGFEITDIYEDCDGGGLFDKYMNSYVAVRATRK
ncbi:class I SAM-dependent methyltransferase [Murimonas intestini]|uniref:Methyltransferase family protein n=1 Tax=Murimonas intestini TaxID=1337051 RepID=A0AB73SYE3_9FIRM|nr:class I SAM-dependent methyltransferase [Murimonas intestini]MCR1868383.1 class I SAM-dependent methyltransferase [Murimonas intestini]MCR1885827.1 class I SAM-dependent methyltransferase [Murimonas intestini]